MDLIASQFESPPRLYKLARSFATVLRWAQRKEWIYIYAAARSRDSLIQSKWIGIIQEYRSHLISFSNSTSATSAIYFIHTAHIERVRSLIDVPWFTLQSTPINILHSPGPAGARAADRQALASARESHMQPRARSNIISLMLIPHRMWQTLVYALFIGAFHSNRAHRSHRRAHLFACKNYKSRSLAS